MAQVRDRKPPLGARGANQQPPLPRIIVVSDVRLYREGLAFGLAAGGGITVVDAVHCLDEALASIAAAHVDVVVLDMASANSLAIAKALSAAVPQIKIVACAVADTEHEVWACAEVGIAGFVPPDGSIDDLAAAIEAALRGELKCSPRMAASLFRRLATLSRDAAVISPIAALTRREREIINLVDCGLSNKEIARRLEIGVMTVKNHVHSILEKLQVHRRGEAAAKLRHGLQTVHRDLRPMRPRDSGNV